MWIKQNRLSIRIVLNTIIVFVLALSALSLTDYLIQSAISANGSVAGFWDYYLGFMTLNVLPVIIIFSIVLFIFVSPIQQIVNKLMNGIKPAPAEMTKAKKRIFRLSAFVLTLNFISFSGGSVVFFFSQGYLTDLGSPRLWFQLVFTLSSSAVYAFLQISLNRQTLAPARELMAIHHLEKGRDFKEMTLHRRTILIGLLLAIYTLAYFLPKVFYSNEIELNYSQHLQNVVNGTQTLEEAEAEFQARYAGLPQAPQFTLASRAFGEQRDNMRLYFLISFLIIIGIAFLVIQVYARELVNQIGVQKTKMRGILSGENSLVDRISIIANDEVGELSSLINEFMGTFEGILRQVATGSGTLAETSQEVDSFVGNAMAAVHEMVASVEQITKSSTGQVGAVVSVQGRLSQMRASIEKIRNDINNQAAFVEQTSSAMTEMATTISSVTRITAQANALGTKLATAAQQGEGQLNQSVMAIETIKSASSNVVDIIKVLADIAEQTNLLAMNAAIEAAHAGDAGRGFAVVASEVRKLAESSANQSKEIFSHINNMTDRIETGILRSREATVSFRSILGYIKETAQLINEISAAMSEQKNGTDEILASVISVVNATSNVQRMTDDLGEQSQDIKQSMDELNLISSQINGATSEQSKSNMEVTQMIAKLRVMSQKNVTVADALEKTIHHFNLNQNGSRKS